MKADDVKRLKELEKEISFEYKVIRTHQIRHDRSKEIGAFASPNGRPRRVKNAQRGVA